MAKSLDVQGISCPFLFLSDKVGAYVSKAYQIKQRSDVVDILKSYI